MDTEPFVITEAKQLLALASSIRSRIFEILQQGTERSVSEIAKMVGASGPRTHYQMERLVEAGLVIPGGKRRVGPRSETLYRAVSTKIKIAPNPESPEFSAAMQALVNTSIRKLEREISKANQTAEQPAVRAIARSGHIKKKDLARLYELFEEAASLIHPGSPERKEDIPLSLRAFTVRLPRS